MSRRSVVAGIAGILLAGAARAAEPRSTVGEYAFSLLGVAGQSTLTTFDTRTPKGFAEVYGPVVETSMFVSRRTEIGFSMNPWIGVRQPVTREGRGRESVSAAAVDIFVRWFPGDFATLHPYLELAEGPSYALERVPSTGSRFNFLSQGGFGVILSRRAGWSWQAGYRLVHFSNAGLGRHNPSWNFNGLVLGGRRSWP